MKKVFQLIYDNETERYEMNGNGLHCGDCFEVLIWNAEKNIAEWVETRIENGRDWYLIGLSGYTIAGLFARALD